MGRNGEEDVPTFWQISELKIGGGSGHTRVESGLGSMTGSSGTEDPEDPGSTNSLPERRTGTTGGIGEGSRTRRPSRRLTVLTLLGPPSLEGLVNVPGTHKVVQTGLEVRIRGRRRPIPVGRPSPRGRGEGGLTHPPS